MQIAKNQYQLKQINSYMNPWQTGNESATQIVSVQYHTFHVPLRFRFLSLYWWYTKAEECIYLTMQ